MMQRFGVKSQQWHLFAADHDPELIEITLSEVVEQIQNWKPTYQKESMFWVLPESYSIFKPKEGDFVRANHPHTKEFSIPAIVTKYYTRPINCTMVSYPGHGWYDDNCEIIMRDNKQFFMPEVENE